ncbi:unnamed protein product, partial [Amoebophrya sp. A120]
HAATSASYDQVSILFSHVEGFHDFSMELDPQDLVNFLNQMFSQFDRICDDNQKVHHGDDGFFFSVDTIGDGYMACAGLPEDNPVHAHAIARCALSMVMLGRQGYFPHPKNPDHTLDIRIGIHSGSCVAGVIGQRKFAFDIWGDAVNTASRMESSGKAGYVQCSDVTHALICEDFECATDGAKLVKGKGWMNTYYVLRQYNPRKHYTV